MNIGDTIQITTARGTYTGTVLDEQTPHCLSIRQGNKIVDVLWKELTELRVIGYPLTHTPQRHSKIGVPR